MAKSEVLIEMPDFPEKYNLGMVEVEQVSSRVRPKQFLHIDESECISVSYTHLTLPTILRV